ncbi:Phosphoserine phosphatase [Lentibacillus sp. JNUCC-1]|uniref:SpoIIE family protein phosphatase n=1 Tax=Lentibacillus sp. JNUCC-1 TaxID=2654513 RepID=UPI0012E710DC|nr:SpoIIE family protein phosphatase [Lentibacillus sp. JNUCC-1]MUV38510.1 Phosphoserine phosphatase [Lentibacillus sp. JNUCC-1]
MTRTDVSVFQKPKNGNYYCGDSYFYEETDTGFICVLADGLGSGEHAKDSSQVVIDVVENNRKATVKELIKLSNKALTGKRGVVLGLLKINFDDKTYSFSSIGNIGVVTITSRSKKKRNIPNSGYLGGYERPFKVETGKLEPDLIFVVFSDGVEDTDLSKPFMLNKNVHALTESFANYKTDPPRDDVTLIAIKYNG